MTKILFQIQTRIYDFTTRYFARGRDRHGSTDRLIHYGKPIPTQGLIVFLAGPTTRIQGTGWRQIAIWYL